MMQTSSTTKKRAGFAPLFTFSLQQFWTTILLFGIILFFVLPVPVLMMVTDHNNYMSTGSHLQRDFISWSETIRILIVPLISVLSVVVACSRLGYLNNKVSVDFYHSLPIKRGQLYLTQLSVGALSLVIPFLINLLITLIVIAANDGITGELMGNLVTMSLETIVYTAFFASLSTLVGMISGLTAVQLALTGVAIFIIPAVYVLIVAFICIFNENMWIDWFLEGDILKNLSPVIRFLRDVDDYLSISEGILMLLAAAAMFTGAYFIYIRRRSERAGTPVVFKPLGEVIKYALVFIGTLGGGLIFYGIMDSLFWTIFGMACGTVLVFMLTNTILQKTAKAMFSGWKILCAYVLVIAVGFIILSTNAFGINTRVPSPAMTSRVEVSFPDTVEGMEFTEIENIQAIYNMYTKGDWEYRNLPSPIWNYESFTMRVVFYPKLGLPVAKSIRIYNKSELIDNFRILLDNDEFKEQYRAALHRVTTGNGQLYTSVNEYLFDIASGEIFRIYRGDYYSQYDEMSLDSPQAINIGLDVFSEEISDVNFDFFQNQVFSEFGIYSNRSYFDADLPIFNTMKKTISRWIENGLVYCTPDEIIDKFSECIDSITVHRVIQTDGEAAAAIISTDGKRVTVEEITDIPNEDEISAVIRDKRKIREILKASINPLGSSYGSTFTFADAEYYATINVRIFDIYDIDFEHPDEIPSEVFDKISRESSYDTSFNLSFLAGQVPDCVINALN